MLTNLLILAVALGTEAAFGYPEMLLRAMGHPVIWIGALIAWLDRRLNRHDDPARRRRSMGVVAEAVLLLAAVAPAFAVQRVLWAMLPPGLALAAIGLLAAALPAQRSLWTHVSEVADALERDGLPAARRAVSRIVGRDPDLLDQAGVVRAAIESLAENFSDGVVAPAFWCAACGLAGVAGYKAVNTADSMIGHRTPRHAAFGWAAARLDDLVNLPASRLAAVWLVLAAALLPRADARGAWQTVRRDAGRHRSPNAGWPEAAMAGALGLRLAGPRVYGGVRVEDGWLGDGRADATAGDLRRALALYRRACAIQLAAVVALALAVAFTARG